MNLIEALALIAALAAVTILPRGEDNPPAVVRTESGCANNARAMI